MRSYDEFSDGVLLVATAGYLLAAALLGVLGWRVAQRRR